MRQFNCQLIGRNGLQHENFIREYYDGETPYDVVKGLEQWQWPGRNEDRFAKWKVCDVTDGFPDDDYGYDDDYTDGGYYAEQAKIKAAEKAEKKTAKAAKVSDTPASELAVSLDLCSTPDAGLADAPAQPETTGPQM